MALAVFLGINIPFIAINCIDIAYFKFTNRRSSIDLLYTVPHSTHSFTNLFFQYWILIAIFLAITTVLYFLSKKILNRLKITIHNRNQYYISSFLFILCFVALARGFNNRAISPATPLLYFSPSLQPLVNNSTLNFMFSLIASKTHLQKKTYFSKDTINSTFPLIKQYDHSKGFNNKNVILFILESFSERLLNSTSKRPSTPFFDSLRNISTIATNCFQNGHESVKGAVSILASVPPFLDEPFFMSNYNTVRFDGIGTLLKKEGYSTNFFLGAEYDHFNFAKLCRMVGISNYYSKQEFNDKSKDDNNWGIYDEYFFDFFSKVTDTIRQPFFNVLYNISSHPPFSIPKKRHQLFANKNPQYAAISYVDFCFKNLFNNFQSKKWFNNSIFVFISDHTIFADNENKYYSKLHIPFFIYDPSDTSTKKIASITQQLDVVPTILDKLNYSKPFMSFGSSIFKDGYKFSISKKNEIYQIIDSSGVTGFNDQTDSIIYFYSNQSNAQPGEKTISKTRRSEELIMGILQQYNNYLIKNSFQ
ncbi:MAG: LTA synthase family protein [Agriterribacter sp.]